jgi:hypothetical protein
MLGGEFPVEKLEALVKAAKVGHKESIKFIAFKNLSRSGKKIINILAEPCDPYKKQDKDAEGNPNPTASW